MEPEVKESIFQRKMLGFLCALLAPSCIIFGLIGGDDNLPGWYMSISATYYASSKICMIGLLFSTSVFFISYKGHDCKDKTISVIQSLSSLGIIVFPCKTFGTPDCVGIFKLPVDTSNIIHCACASILFVAFAVNIFFLFTLGNTDNPQKRKRNTVYRVCAIVIFAFCIIQLLSSVTNLFAWVPEKFPLTWFNEFVMLEAFAVAWLVKAEYIEFLNDKGEYKEHSEKNENVECETL